MSTYLSCTLRSSMTIIHSTRSFKRSLGVIRCCNHPIGTFQTNITSCQRSANLSNASPHEEQRRNLSFINSSRRKQNILSSLKNNSIQNMKFSTSNSNGTNNLLQYFNYDAPVITTSKLNVNDLQRLFRHEITALHVRDFYPKSTAIELGNELANQAREGRANNWKVMTTNKDDYYNSSSSSSSSPPATTMESSDVFTLGAHLPFNVAVATNTIDEYYQQVPFELQQRRRRRQDHQQQSTSSSAKVIWPLDQFRLELDEVWPYGAGLARQHETTDVVPTDAPPPTFLSNQTTTESSSMVDPIGINPCRGGGLPRIMMGPTRWRKGFVHMDEMAPLSTEQGIFTANIYLQLPPSPPQQGPDGNENSNNDDDHDDDSGINVLEIWPLDIRSKMDWYQNADILSALASQDAEQQILLRKALGGGKSSSSTKATTTTMPYRIAVTPGDLVLFSVQRPHAAIGFTNPGSIRVSLQCFLQYQGTRHRLLIES